MFIFFSRSDRFFSSKHNVAPLYWSLPLGVLCQQTLPNNGFLSDHFLISPIFSLVKEYLLRMNLEILILHFENENCFDVSLKTFPFEILQLLGFFLGKEIICSFIWRYCIWWKYIMRWPFVSYRFSKWRAREKARGFVWEKLISFWTLMLSAWVIMNSLFSMSRL